MGKIVSFRIDDESIEKAMKRFGLTVDDTKELTAKINSTALELFKEWLLNKGDRQSETVNPKILAFLRERLQIKQKMLDDDADEIRSLKNDVFLLLAQIDAMMDAVGDAGLILVTKRLQEKVNSLKAENKELRKDKRHLNFELSQMPTFAVKIPDFDEKINSLDDFNNWLGD